MEETTARQSEGTSTMDTFKNRTMAVWLLVLSVIGSIASGLLMYERVALWADSDHTTACDLNPWVSCGQVMETWQASTFGFPNILIGIVLFPALAILALTLLLNKDFEQKVWYFIEAGTTFAFLFVVWLYISAVFVINVLCPYCMIVWAAVIPLSTLVFTRNRLAEQRWSPKTKQLIRSWWWTVMILLFLVVVGTIIVQFPYAFF